MEGNVRRSPRGAANKQKENDNAKLNALRKRLKLHSADELNAHRNIDGDAAGGEGDAQAPSGVADAVNTKKQRVQPPAMRCSPSMF